MSDDDEIAAFHRAAARRDRMILIIGGAIALAAGIVALIIGFTMETPVGAERMNAKVLGLGAVLAVAGLGGIGKGVLGHRD